MHETAIHIVPTDCDMQGHVNHATMIALLERARWALVETMGPIGEFTAGGTWSVVRHVDIAYHRQSVPGDDLVVRSGLREVRTTSFVVRQEVRRRAAGDVPDDGGAPALGALVAEASVTLVAVDRDGRPVPVPADWRARFPRWSGSEGAT